VRSLGSFLRMTPRECPVDQRPAVLATVVSLARSARPTTAPLGEARSTWLVRLLRVSRAPLFVRRVCLSCDPRSCTLPDCTFARSCHAPSHRAVGVARPVPTCSSGPLPLGSRAPADDTKRAIPSPVDDGDGIAPVPERVEHARALQLDRWWLPAQARPAQGGARCAPISRLTLWPSRSRASPCRFRRRPRC
jgi:hypothetical protein